MKLWIKNRQILPSIIVCVLLPLLVVLTKDVRISFPELLGKNAVECQFSYILSFPYTMMFFSSLYGRVVDEENIDRHTWLYDLLFLLFLSILAITASIIINDMGFFRNVLGISGFGLLLTKFMPINYVALLGGIWMFVAGVGGFGYEGVATWAWPVSDSTDAWIWAISLIALGILSFVSQNATLTNKKTHSN